MKIIGRIVHEAKCPRTRSLRWSLIRLMVTIWLRCSVLFFGHNTKLQLIVDGM